MSTEALEPGGHREGSRIIEQDIQRELKDSYLTYAMSTIMDRALPDVRDGLKPSQRRLLWAMNELNLRPNRKHMKCAKIVGETMGNYHPHGDVALYGTLVGMAQSWRMRVPLVNPQGNFGSIEGDPPAAMRYTEARMAPAAADMLADADLETVDFVPNYDETRQEPTVLPARFPNLLINGGVGIAVGMATSLLPHNPTEVFDALIRTVDARLAGRQQVSIEELMTDEIGPDGTILRRGLKGPDFPTGGIVAGKRGILEAYATGRGKITLRGTTRIEDLPGDRTQIIIDSIPYMVAQNGLVEKIVEAVREEKVQNVDDVRNESGREAATRIVLELKKGADPRVCEKQLFEFTPLSETVSIINIALVNRRPQTLGLHEMIDHYLAHRTDVIRRRTSHLLTEARKKAHLLEGLILAVCDIDEVIREIRASRSREEAIDRLARRRFVIPPDHRHLSVLPADLAARIARGGAEGLLLTRVQAESIGAMRLIQLVGLEIERLVADYAKVMGEITEYEGILSSPRRVLELIRSDLLEMRQRYDTPRLTAIEDADEEIVIEDLIPVEDVAITISHLGYVKRVPLQTYRQQGRGGKGIRASDARENDFIEHVFVASTHDHLLCFTDTGRLFRMRVYEIPEMSRSAVGRNIVNLINLKAGERTCAYLAIRSFEAGSEFLTFVSRHGIVKRTPLKAYANSTRAGLIAVGLKDGDSLLDVAITGGQDDLLLVTAGGMAIRFNEQDVRDMGRSASGVKGIDLSENDEVIALATIPMSPDADGDLMTADPSMALLTITERGYGKRTLIDEYRVQPETGKLYSQSRAGKGRVDIDTGERNGRSVAALIVRSGDDVVVVTRQGQLVRLSADTIRLCGRGSMGVRIVALNEGDSVVAAARVPESERTEQDASGGA
jgi:DNA gyrase subunit A